MRLLRLLRLLRVLRVLRVLRFLRETRRVFERLPPPNLRPQPQAISTYMYFYLRDFLVLRFFLDFFDLRDLRDLPPAILLGLGWALNI